MQTATNPQTGEKVQWDGSAWKPVGGPAPQQGPTIYRTPAKPIAQQRPAEALGDDLSNTQKQQAIAEAPLDYRKKSLEVRKAEEELAAGDAAKASEGERKNAAFLRRAQGANQEYEALGIGPRTYVGDIVQDAAPGLLNQLPGAIGNSSDRQQADAAELEFISAILRSDSGAAIPPEEIEAARKLYFPEPGEDPPVIKQKAEARQRAIDGLLSSAGRLADEAALSVDVPGSAQTGTPGEKVERNGVIVGFYGPDGNLVNIDTGPNFDVDGNPIPADQLNADAERQRQEMLNQRADSQEALTGEAGIGTRIASGATLGFNDEISGVVGGVAGIFNGEGVVEGYRNARDTKRIINQRADERTGTLGTVAEIGGGLLLPGMGLAKAGGAVRQGMKAGAIGGGLAGAGYGEGVEGTATGAVVGGLGGAALGAAIPAAIGAARPVFNAGKRALGRDKNVAINQVGKALAADGNTPRSASKTIADAQSRNSPMSIADTGENARQLLGSVSRQPGPARRIGVETTSKRQEEQLERISSAVRRDLGPTANIRELGEALIDKARKDSRPIYEKFENNSGAGALFPKIEGLLARPSMQKALKNAEKTMKEEGVDPKSLGFDLDAQGEVILTKVPSFKALDYIKRGADDVIEKYRDTTTGKLVLDGQGRAANDTLRAFIARVDKANPDYAAARAAYAGPAKMKSALEKGAKALRKSPDDIMAEMKSLTPSEKEMYRNGVRKGIVDLLEGKGDYADKVNALIGTEKSRKTLTRVFGGKAGFERFIKTLRDEREIGLTYKAVNTGSPTAKNLAFDAETSGNNVLSSAIDVADSANRSGVVGAVSNLIGKVREAGTLGTGKAGDEARESIAALLSETGPAELKLIVESARRLAAEQRLLKRKQIRNAGRQGNASGRGAVITTEDSRPK